jgi:hypothetical protein
VSGILRKAELDGAQDVLMADLGWVPGGKVRLLVVLDKFDGWDGLSNWSDLTFFARYGTTSSASPSSVSRGGGITPDVRRGRSAASPGRVFCRRRHGRRARLAVALMTHGSSFPLGATLSKDGVNFSLFAKGATGVELLLFDRADSGAPSRSVVLDPERHRSYHYWHTFVPASPGQIYAYRAEGRSTAERLSLQPR